MKIKYIIDVSPITDQFVLLDTRDGNGADINHEVAMGLFNDPHFNKAPLLSRNGV